MLKRIIERLVRNRLKIYPAVALIGPRQCGKTTLAQSMTGAYFDLEQEAERLRLDLEWGNLMSGKKFGHPSFLGLHILNELVIVRSVLKIGTPLQKCCSDSRMFKKRAVAKRYVFM